MGPQATERDANELAHYIKTARSEAGFQRAIEHFAKLMGWLVFHDRDSRKNNEGFPDLVMVRNALLIFAELKTGKYQRTDAQVAWGDALEWVENTLVDRPRDNVRYYLWYPSDWEEIIEVLRQPWITVTLT